MVESTSRYFRTLPIEGQGDAVIEQIFPVPDGKPNKLVGQAAEGILKLSGRVGVMRVRNRAEASSDASARQEYVYSGQRLEFRQQPDLDNINKSYSLLGWELQDDGPELIRQIEAQLGISGLTIVLERGILEWPVDQTQPA